MFPLKWSFPLIKKDGKRTTIGDAIDNAGGQYTLPTASENVKGGIKIGLGLSMTGDTLNNTNPTPYSLPIASSEILGGVKIGSGLSINGEGVVSAGGDIYYKDFNNVTWQTSIHLAKFADGAASDSGYQICATAASGVAGYTIDVPDYTPIAAIAYDRYSGYQFNVGLEYSYNAHRIGIGIANREISSGSLYVRVYYVKTSNVHQITT